MINKTFFLVVAFLGLSFLAQAQNFAAPPVPGFQSGYRPIPGPHYPGPGFVPGYRPMPYPAPMPIYPVNPYPPIALPPIYNQYPPIYNQSYGVTCNTVGLVNGLIYYGVGTDIYSATERSFFVCQSVGQVCRLLGCH